MEILENETKPISYPIPNITVFSLFIIIYENTKRKKNLLKKPIN